MNKLVCPCHLDGRVHRIQEQPASRQEGGEVEQDEGKIQQLPATLHEVPELQLLPTIRQEVGQVDQEEGGQELKQLPSIRQEGGQIN